MIYRAGILCCGATSIMQVSVDIGYKARDRFVITKGLADGQVFSAGWQQVVCTDHDDCTAID